MKKVLIFMSLCLSACTSWFPDPDINGLKWEYPKIYKIERCVDFEGTYLVNNQSYYRFFFFDQQNDFSKNPLWSWVDWEKRGNTIVKVIRLSDKFKIFITDGKSVVETKWEADGFKDGCYEDMFLRRRYQVSTGWTESFGAGQVLYYETIIKKLGSTDLEVTYNDWKQEGVVFGYNTPKKLSTKKQTIKRVSDSEIPADILKKLNEATESGVEK